MTGGLSVELHDPWAARPPEGWQKFVDRQGLHAHWDWAFTNACAVDGRPVVACTVQDGHTVRGLLTARLLGPRLGSGTGTRPLAGVLDVTCLYSSAEPGLVLDDESLTGEAIAEVRRALRREFGARLRGLLLRQVSAARLPAVLRWPAVVREGGPIAVFTNSFGDFDDYLGALPKKRRHFVRRTLRTIDGAPELTTRFTARGDPRGPLPPARLRALGDSVVERNHRAWWLRKRFTGAAAMHAALAHDRVEWLTYHQGEELLAYAQLWQHEDLPHLGGWGAESIHDGGRRDLWFHFIVTTIRWCVEARRAGIVGGQGTATAKRRLGFDLNRQWAVLIPQ